jgi:aldehyde dehydrogenase (NAD+)
MSAQTFDSINPATGEVIAQVALGDERDVDRAVAAAKAAFHGPWRSFLPVQRERVMLHFADLVQRHGEELRMLDVVDMGSPAGPNPGAWGAGAASTLRYYAGWPSKIHGETVPNSVATTMFSYTLREPVGVVAAIIPWNIPLGAAIAKIAPVLATGCTMVLKPAEEASLTALRLGELIQELDLPPGVINIVTGYGHTAGAALAAHPDVDKVAFTGSSATGREIVRASAGNLKRISLELGGKSPDIVFADADLDIAVPGAARGVFHNSGQACFAGTRIYVERPIYDEFVAGVADVARALKVGDTLDPSTEIGPLVSRAQLERVTGYLEIGMDEGARCVVGGSRLVDGPLAKGYYIPPTVFADVRDEMRIAREEIFGPVASILPFDTVEEVVQRSNDTEFGLASGVWTRDVAKAHHLTSQLRAGTVWVNTFGQFDSAMPFGGYKSSGWGTEGGVHSLDDYLLVKGAWINTA